MSSTLVAHNPKFAAKVATLSQLRALPAPAALGRWHRPIPHADLVDVIHIEADRRGMQIIREQFALGNEGGALFATVDFAGKGNERCTALGFRNSTDQSLALQAVAGSHVFVCDNLALSGEFEAWSHKNTLHVDLRSLVRGGFDAFARQSEAFESSIKRLEGSTITDDEAKSRLWDVFADGVLPTKLLAEAHTNYFAPDESWTDCAPRTAWGLHNALTRTVRQLNPTRVLDVTADLGKAFGIGI